MQTIYKMILLAGIALATANQSEAQAGRKLSQADAAKLPSHRPMPDMVAMQQKINKMRADANRQQALQKQNNEGRKNQLDRPQAGNKQPVTTPVKQ